jgi:hypothetical protein
MAFSRFLHHCFVVWLKGKLHAERGEEIGDRIDYMAPK